MISPSDIEAEIRAESAVIFEEAERMIDSALRERYGDLPIGILVSEAWTPQICQALMRGYRERGWDVVRYCSMATGDTLEFSIAEGR